MATPHLSATVAYGLGYFERDCFALSDNALDCPCTDVSQGCLSTLNQSLTEIGYDEGCTVRVRDLEVHRGRKCYRRVGLIRTKIEY